MPKQSYIINSIIRAIKVLDSFTFEKTIFKFSEFEKQLGFNKTTLLRVLASLVEAGVLEHNEKTREYRIAYPLFRIGNIYREQMNLYEAALPFMSKLSAETGETIHLAILVDFKVLYIGKTESPQSISIRSKVGDSNPCYATGCGKAILANLEKDEKERFFNSIKIERLTPKTICEPGELEKHLKQIQEQGYSIDDGENEEEVRCVAAPIFDNHGKILASISIAGPIYRMTHEKIDSEFISAIKETAKNISMRVA